jgi:hypothetical protein
MSLNLESHFVGNVYIIRCKGAIVAGDRFESLQMELDLGTHEFSRPVLDVRGTDRLDSFGVGLLVRYTVRLRKRGTALVPRARAFELGPEFKVLDCLEGGGRHPASDVRRLGGKSASMPIDLRLNQMEISELTLGSMNISAANLVPATQPCLTNLCQRRDHSIDTHKR